MLGIILAVLLAQPLSALQPSAPNPVAAPIRDLPWGDLNFLATTDTHGWHAGHLQEPQYAADWGDYISFASHLRAKADEYGVDLLLVDTGDRVDGNGLYDGSDPKGKYTYDIFKEQHIDIICSGNHELYEAATSNREWTQTIPNFKDKYLASNLDIIDPKTGNRTALARRYRKFKTKNRGLEIVAFGFLFDFTGNANNTFVQRVEDTIQEVWFQDAIREKVDAFVIIGHVALRSPEYKAIYNAIRTQNWDVPIQFFGGHSHIRDYMSYDSAAFALESGRYMETIGWMSIDNIGPKDEARRQGTSELSAKSSPVFKRRYIDNNLFGYHHHTGLNDTTFPTDHGKNVSSFIHSARKEMNLDKKYGCVPRDLYLNRAPYPSNNSIYTWLEEQVLPDVLRAEEESKDTPKITIVNTGAVRFDIFAGQYTRDTVYIVCPFRNQFRVIRNVPYRAAQGILEVLNSGGRVLSSLSEGETGNKLAEWMLAPPEQMHKTTDFVAPEIADVSGSGGTQKVFSELKKRSAPKSNLIPGYTTKDDAGSDGDDTLHSPLSFYRMPNVFESRIDFVKEDPEFVDVVFIDFVQPWILVALKYLGHGVTPADTHPYLEGKTFTVLMQEWITKHWSTDC